MVREAMRERRVQLGLTQEAIALDLGVATSTYREWERGVSTPRVGYRPKIARRLNVSLAEVHFYLDGEPKPVAPDGQAVPAWLGHYGALEQGAAQIRTFEPIIVPGLLQTRDYAIAVESVEYLPVTGEEVARRVENRIARQAVLHRSTDPLRLHAVVDESVLRRRTGDPDVMIGQLAHLVDMAERPNVDLRVTALDARVHPAAFGAFQLLTSPGGSSPYVACAADLTGFRYHESRAAIDAHVVLFDHLSRISLPPDESVERINDIAKELHR